MIDVNPAKQGVDNPQRRRTEKRPFESWAQLAAVASRLDDCNGALVMFAAATGLRPGEWIALEGRDIDRVARVVYVRRAYRNGRLKCTKTEGSVRAVPLQAVALEALDRLPAHADTELLFPSVRGVLSEDALEIFAGHAFLALRDVVLCSLGQRHMPNRSGARSRTQRLFQ